MAVRITGGKPKRYRPMARSFTNEDLRAIASEFIKRQAAGIVIARDLAASLNDDGIDRPDSGGDWNATLVYHLLKRGKALSLPFVVRDRSTAASLRRVMRRPKDVIAAERAQGLKKLAAIGRAKTAMIAANDGEAGL